MTETDRDQEGPRRGRRRLHRGLARSTPRPTACSTAATRCRSSPRRSRSRRSPTCSGTASCRPTTQLAAASAPSERAQPRARRRTSGRRSTCVPLDAHPMDVVRTAVSPDRRVATRRAYDTSREADLAQVACACSRSCPAIVALRPAPPPRPGSSSTRATTSTTRQNFLWMTFGEVPDPVVVDAFNVSMILYAEHSFNASTFTARVITSTLADLYSAVVGAIGALKGPLHGGANEAVMHIFDEIGTAENVGPWLDARARREAQDHGLRPPRLQARRLARADHEGRARHPRRALRPRRTSPTLYDTLESRVRRAQGHLPEPRLPVRARRTTSWASTP